MNARLRGGGSSLNLNLSVFPPGGGWMPMTPFMERFPEVGARETSYGWESADFYRKWSAGSDPIEMKRLCLDTLNAQTQYSSALLDLFRLLLESHDYVDRLKRHYQMFRDSVERNARRRRLETNRMENLRKRLRDPKRRRHPH
jgi:hypothetical protein